MRSIYIVFIIALLAANLIVKHFGAYGLWFSSALLIPFDFVVRCVVHEKLKGLTLIWTLFELTLIAAAVTIFCNYDAKNIALASICGFTAAQIGAGLFYQTFKQRKSFFFKVNLSDLIAIVCDSIIFQLVAFSLFNPSVTIGQIAIKLVGGFVWYLIIFKTNLHVRILRKY